MGCKYKQKGLKKQNNKTYYFGDNHKFFFTERSLSKLF